MNPLDPLNELAQVGFGSTCVAATLIPTGWACAGKMLTMMGDPGALMDAGLEWIEVGKRLQDAVSENMALTNSIGSAWRGEDYDAFVAKAADLSRQMMMAMVHAYLVGAALLAAAVALSMACVIIIAMGVGFLIHFTIISTAMASVVGNLGATQAAMVAANAYGASCLAQLTAYGATLTTTYHVIAGALGATTAANIGLQIAFGNEQALGDLAQAAVISLPTIAAGLTSYFFTSRLGAAMGPGSDLLRTLGLVVGVSGVNPVEEVTEPIDPTRWG